MTTESDTGYAPDRWEFDDEVSRVFDDMLDRSIPQYETMREAVTLIASSFLGLRSHVLDLGCSRGGAIAAIAGLEATERCRFTGLEISPPMLEAARERFEFDDRVSIYKTDLRRPLDNYKADIILCVLTLMFVPINYRQRLLTQCREILGDSGGGLILVEKVMGEGPRLDDVFNANYHRKKADSGYAPDEIQRKRLSLEGVLVPMNSTWNMAMLRTAGFREIDVFWRWMNFVGIVATV